MGKCIMSRMHSGQISNFLTVAVKEKREEGSFYDKFSELLIFDI
jgi:hypothetical protein